MKHTPSTGFFLIEVVVAASIIATVLMLLLGSIEDSVEASRHSLERTQASYLLEEGAEAVKSIRDTGWTSITALTDGTTYYLSWNGTAWTLTTTPQTTDIFTRTIVLSPVSRDSTDDIVSSGGTVDTDTKKVTVHVTWSTATAIQSEDLQFYIANIR